MSHRTRWLPILTAALALELGIRSANAGPIFANDTSRLSFQAFLSDDQGNALPDGTVDLSFTIYDPITGPIEGPINVPGVPIAGGVVNCFVPVSRSSWDGLAREMGVRVNGGDELAPRIPLVAVPHAMRVDRVESDELTDNVRLGDTGGATGSMTVMRDDGTTSIELDGASGEIRTTNNTGVAQFVADSTGTLQVLTPSGNLAGRMTASGDLQVNDINTNFPSIYLSGSTGFVSAPNGYQLYNFLSEAYRGGLYVNTHGGRFDLYDSTGNLMIQGGARNQDGGFLEVLQETGIHGVQLEGEGTGTGGAVSVYNASGTRVLDARNDNNNNGFLALRNSTGSTRVRLLSDDNDTSGSVSLYDPAGNESVEIHGKGGAGGGEMTLRDGSGTPTVSIEAAEAPGQGAQIQLGKLNGVATITLDADYNGNGRITTQVLEITGGSDLSEQFNVGFDGGTVQPGMVVSINPGKPGELVVSTTPYDRTVAGIVSGAGGIQTGMLMGQSRSIADGRHAIALTGRVYCLCDASNGAIRPGDLLTTSSIAGHAVKVTDHAKATGAIIGKAMTSLEEGRGLVLVLVSLQ